MTRRPLRVLKVLVGLVALHALWLAFRWGGARATDVASDVFQVVVIWAAAVWTASSARKARDHRLAWTLLAAGIAFWAAATSYWAYSEIFRDSLLPVPSLADAGWLMYPVLATAAFLVAALRGRSRAQVGVAALDTVLTAVGLFLIVWTVLLEDAWAAATGSPLMLAITMAYPLGDVAVVTAALGFLFRLRPGDRLRLWALPVGAAAVALGNLNLSWSYLHDGFQSGSVSDVLWTAGLALLGHGVHVATQAAPRPIPAFATPFEQALPYVVAFAALGFLAGHYTLVHAPGRVDLAIPLLWTLTFLVRQFLFLRHSVEVHARLEDAQVLAGVGSWEWTSRGILLSPLADGLLRGSPTPAEASGPVPLAEALGSLPEGERKALAADLRMLMDSGKPVERHVRLPAGGKVRHVMVHGSGAPARGTVHDITRDVEAGQRRQREEADAAELARLGELNRLKTQFINMAAHELNTPMTPIQLTLASLRAPSRDEAAAQRKQRELLPLLQRNVDRLGDMLKDVLDAARLQSSRLELRKKAVRLDEAARALAEELGPSADAAGLRILVEAQPVTVDADPGRLHEVLLNLANNAIKFTPPGGTVHLRVSADGRGGQVELRDTGTGIGQEDLAQLFQPFTQVGDGVVRTKQGTGLGLYLCKGIVEGHGGRIWARSPGPGHGSTFGFELPLSSSVQDGTGAAAAPMPVAASLANRGAVPAA